MCYLACKGLELGLDVGHIDGVLAEDLQELLQLAKTKIKIK